MKSNVSNDIRSRMMHNKNDFTELPKGWIRTRLGDIIEKIALTGKKLKQSEYQKIGRLPVIDQSQIFIGGYTDKEELKVICDLPVIVFGDHTKVFKYVNFDFVAGADGVKTIKPLEIFYPKLFYYFVQVIQLPEKGYARHFQFLDKSFIKVPPLPEQHRIVAKIEELFTKLDAGIKALKKIKKQLKCYRQSVLKSAFEGKLTEEWREKHLPAQAGKDELEPTSLLLRDKTKDIYKTHRKNLPSVDDLQSNDLPANWSYATLPYLVTNEKYSIKRGPFGSSIKKEYFVSSGYKVYEQQNVIKNDFKLGKYYINEEKFQEMKAFEIKTGDILISCSGTIGRIVVVPESYKKGIINQALLKLTLDNNVIVTEFFVYLFRYFVKEKEFYANIKGVAIKNIASVKELKKILFKLPPFLEQQKIVEEIEHHFSIADEIEKVVVQNLKQSKQLRQSILKKAFKGKLVPQDSTDEPAEELLERIKAEKEKHKAKEELKRKTKIK